MKLDNYLALFENRPLNYVDRFFEHILYLPNTQAAWPPEKCILRVDDWL